METDFIGFSYGKTHLLRDLKIYRVSEGSRFNTNLIPTLTDKTADVPGGEGQYLFNTVHKNRTISVSFAFDELTEQDLRELRKLFDGQKIEELIFDEQPYKAYSAKVTGTPVIKTLCFDNIEGKRVYRGEGSVTFTCYYPYAHTPNWVWKTDDGVNYYYIAADGRLISSYDDLAYPTKDQWNEGAKLTDSVSINLGDVEAPFIVSNASGTVTVAGNQINIQGVGTWDSSTGLVKDSNGAILATTGQVHATIPSGAQATTSVGNLDYEYWYY